MSEEAKSAAETTEVPDEGASAMATILAAVKDNPSLAEDPEIKTVIEMANKANQGAEQPPAKQKTEKTFESKEDNTDEQPTKEPTTESEDSLFFKKDETDDKEEVDVKDFDGAKDYIKEKYSIDDMDTFFSSVDKWRKVSQETGHSQEKLEDIQDAFTKMPEPLFNAFNSWANGGDWKNPLSGIGGGLDYSANFGDYDTYEIVNFYFPGEYEKDDFDGHTEDKIVQRATKLAQSQYETERQAFEDERAVYMNQAEERQALIKDSTTSSVNILKEAFPDFGKKALKKVKDTMVSGDLSGLFYDKDGSYSKDAAIKVALALFGKDEIKRAKSRADKSQEVLRNNVDKTADKPSVKSTQSQQAQIPEEVTGIFKDVFVKKYY